MMIITMDDNKIEDLWCSCTKFISIILRWLNHWFRRHVLAIWRGGAAHRAWLSSGHPNVERGALSYWRGLPVPRQEDLLFQGETFLGVWRREDGGDKVEPNGIRRILAALSKGAGGRRHGRRSASCIVWTCPCHSPLLPPPNFAFNQNWNFFHAMYTLDHSPTTSLTSKVLVWKHSSQYLYSALFITLQTNCTLHIHSHARQSSCGCIIYKIKCQKERILIHSVRVGESQVEGS